MSTISLNLLTLRNNVVIIGYTRKYVYGGFYGKYSKSLYGMYE